MQHDGKSSLVKGFHDNWTYSLVIGKEVEDGEEEEEAESQPEGQKIGWCSRITLIIQSHFALIVLWKSFHLHWIISDKGNEYQTDQQSSQIHQSLLWKTDFWHVRENKLYVIKLITEF